jgi:hypothetical protein
MILNLKYKQISAFVFGALLMAFGFHQTVYAQDDDVSDAVYKLAQGCYAIKSAAEEKFLLPVDKEYTSYHFQPVGVESASHFYFKPTSIPGYYLLRDYNSQFLGTALRGDIPSLVLGNYPNEDTEWKVVVQGSDNQFKFIPVKYEKLSLKRRKEGDSKSSTTIEVDDAYLADIDSPSSDEESFKVVSLAKEKCTPFPEAAVGVVDVVPKTRMGSDMSKLVFGFADLHTHVTSDKFLGGLFFQGKPFHRYGIEKALCDGKLVHGPNGSYDIVGNNQDSKNSPHDTKGYPDFPAWPNHHSTSHQQTYYKWIERAHLAGLKLMVVNLVENEILCTVQSILDIAFRPSLSGQGGDHCPSPDNQIAISTTDEAPYEVREVREVDELDKVDEACQKKVLNVLREAEAFEEIDEACQRQVLNVLRKVGVLDEIDEAHQRKIVNALREIGAFEEIDGARQNITLDDVKEVIKKILRVVRSLRFNHCNAMLSVDRQYEYLKEIETYIDLQSGGPGKGFFRIVKSPSEARDVIAQGKLAVVMGIEVSNLFNCKLEGGEACTEQSVREKLDRYYNLGIRSLYLVHRFDNQFGGTSLTNAQDIMNGANWLETGHFFDAECCEDNPYGEFSNIELKSRIPGIGELIDALIPPEDFGNTLAQIAANTIFTLVTDESPPSYPTCQRTHCNKRDLSKVGESLIKAMIDKGMIIELDHMSPRMKDAVLTLLKEHNNNSGYSGVLSVHVGLLGENGNLTSLDKRILELGGLIFPYNGPSTGFINTQRKIRAGMKKENHPYIGIGFSTDVNGLTHQAAPMFDKEGNLLPPYEEENKEENPEPVEYDDGFQSIDGNKRIFQQQTGERVFDLNYEGIAHYGLLADHVESIRLNGCKGIENCDCKPKDGKTVEEQFGECEAIMDLFKSAEAYLQMWERVTGTTR